MTSTGPKESWWPSAAILAYLKIAGKVEEVPLERLSAVDQAYLATLSLVPMLPGPADNVEQAAAFLPQEPEEMPLPGESAGPELAPATGIATAQQVMPPGTYRIDPSGRVIPLPAGPSPSYRTGNTGPRPTAKSNRDDDDDRPGLFGARARRLERQRAAAQRSR